MHCTRCGCENRAGTKFCNECAAPLPVHCDTCGVENRPGAKYGIMALFGAPIAPEDHAVRACYVALDMQEALHHYNAKVRRTQGIEVQIRVGLNSGALYRAMAMTFWLPQTEAALTQVEER